MNIHTRDFGTGARDVLAVHCTLGTSGAWRGVSAALPEATFHAFDLPCHGRSDDWDGQGDLHDVVTAEALRLMTQPMDLVGHSFGATVALRLGAERPDLVRSMVLIEPVFFAPVFVDFPEKAAAHAARNEAYDAAMDAGDMMEAARAFNRGWGDGTRWDAIPQQMRQYMADRIHFVRASAPMVMHDHPGLLARGLLEACTVPTLLLEGSQTDPMIHLADTAIAKRLQNARVERLEGLGHMAPITDPEPVAAAIQRFWAGL
ncbi:MAG: alpha/beta hydrolase [Pseudomonadota bacterium]